MPSNWPALIIGLIVAMYWARVLYMALKASRRPGHGANFIPPEPLGRALRIIWIPIVALWIGLPLAAAFMRSAGRRWPLVLRPFPAPAFLGWTAVGIAVLAYIATLFAWRKMGSSWRMGIDPDDHTQLIVSGPFAYVRHPIYALSSALMLATLAVVLSAAMIAVCIFHLLLLQWEARREERYLHQIHGQEFGQYAARTGRFLPCSIRPYKRSASQPRAG